MPYVRVYNYQCQECYKQTSIQNSPLYCKACGKPLCNRCSVRRSGYCSKCHIRSPPELRAKKKASKYVMIWMPLLAIFIPGSSSQIITKIMYVMLLFIIFAIVNIKLGSKMKKKIMEVNPNAQNFGPKDYSPISSPNSHTSLFDSQSTSSLFEEPHQNASTSSSGSIPLPSRNEVPEKPKDIKKQFSWDFEDEEESEPTFSASRNDELSAKTERLPVHDFSEFTSSAEPPTDNKMSFESEFEDNEPRISSYTENPNFEEPQNSENVFETDFTNKKSIFGEKQLKFEENQEDSQFSSPFDSYPETPQSPPSSDFGSMEFIPVLLECEVEENLIEMKVVYSFDEGATWGELTMIRDGIRYHATLYGVTKGTKVIYYFKGVGVAGPFSTDNQGYYEKIAE